LELPNINPAVTASSPGPDTLPRRIGRKLIDALATFQGLGAFGLITLGVLLTKLQTASQVVHPLIRREVRRSAVQLLPMVLFISGALGLVVIGQTVMLLTRVGAQDLAGTIMVTAVVRELGPVIAALVVLARVGSATVIELATARALGEVEALEAISIDPVHFLVVPRVIGMMLAVFTLTIYLILGALASGYLFAFLQDVPLLPGDYVRQLASALGWADFLLLALKTCAFGLVISVVTCYHGLARPLSLDDISHATVRAMVHGLLGCVLLDALFILVYLLI
jgi:phospholipid/cholesterol/gamma-HCH transport system permease protein